VPAQAGATHIACIGGFKIAITARSRQLGTCWHAIGDEDDPRTLLAS
jgi:hypothetical protein